MIELDATDKAILRFLQADCQMTMKEMAAELHLTITPVFERIKKLERLGLISDYVALVDPVRVGYKLYAFIDISISDHSKDAIEGFIAQVIKYPEVMECHHVTGESDFLLKVLLRDVESYNHFVLNKLSTVPNIGKVGTRFSLSVRKDTHVIAF